MSGETILIAVLVVLVIGGAFALLSKFTGKGFPGSKDQGQD